MEVFTSNRVIPIFWWQWTKKNGLEIKKKKDDNANAARPWTSTPGLVR